MATMALTTGRPASSWRVRSIPTSAEDSAKDLRKAIRFAITLPVHYRTDHGAGRGELRNISSCGALFTTERPLVLNADVKLSVKWPVLLSDSVNLSLAIAGKVVRVEPGQAAVKIHSYQFRTCNPSSFAAAADRNASGGGPRLQVQVANHAVKRVGM